MRLDGTPPVKTGRPFYPQFLIFAGNSVHGFCDMDFFKLKNPALHETRYTSRMNQIIDVL